MRRIARHERAAFIALTTLVFAHLLLRAVFVPIVHDEARSFHLYVLTGDFLPFVAHWDAANHLLLTALSQLNYPILGASLVSLRMWSVLAFLLYAWYVGRFAAYLRTPLIRWTFAVAMLTMPFMIEFFALHRGYGLGLAFMMMAVHHVLSFARDDREKDLVLALAAITLATWAMLSLLVLWSAILIVLLCLILRSHGGRPLSTRAFWSIAIGAIPLMFTAFYAVALSNRGLLYYGSDAGWFHGTWSSLSRAVVDKDPEVVLRLFGAIVAGSALAAFTLRGKVQGPVWTRPLLILGAMLLMVHAGQSVLFETMGGLYPLDRAAMYLMPLVVCFITEGIDAWTVRFPACRFLALPLWLLPVCSLFNAQWDHTRLWPDQSVPETFFTAVEARQRSSDRLLVIGGQEFVKQDTWSYGNRQRGGWLNELESIDFPQGTCDLLLIDTTASPRPEGFRTVATAPSGRINLMERTTPLRTIVVLDSTIAMPSTNAEFLGFWAADARRWVDRSAIVELNATIHADGKLTHSSFVVDIVDTSGAQLIWNNSKLDPRRGPVEESETRISRWFPPMGAGARRISAYLYNPDHRWLEVEHARIVVYEILP